MQNDNLDTNKVIIEYFTEGQGNSIKKLKPLLIKSEPDREYTQNIQSDNNLPAVPKENFIQKREVTIDSYSETISSNDSSDDRTITADSDSSATSSFEETPCKWESDSKGIEATLQQTALGLQHAAGGYLTLASHISKLALYELPQVIAQIPPLPRDVAMPIRKVVSVDRESKAVDYLLHGEYELNKTLWSKLQKSTILVEIRSMQLLQEKEDPEAPNINKEENKHL